MKIAGRIVSILLISSCLSGCSYIHHTFKQAGYASQFKKDQRRSIQKHLLTSETFFVYGKLIEKEITYKDYALAIAALANVGNESEIVDITHMVRVNSFYGLNLPSGDYQVVSLADLDDNGFYTNSEIVASLPLQVNSNIYPDHVAGGIDIVISNSFSQDFLSPFKIGVHNQQRNRVEQSIFYPKGTIRNLDDPIFSETNAQLGMYSPADFMEQAPMMFYALEEDLGHKIPVIFVHGVGGSVTEFSSIIKRLDRQRYKPWFYYYPSGADLEKLAHLFYRIFISGRLVELDDRIPVVVIAHSMGGLIVRKAINLYQGKPEENKIRLFVSIATPFGGHPDAKIGIENAPLVLPSWNNMNPEGEFINNLYAEPIPDFIEHHLFYAFGNSSTVKIGENSDGVVPLSSQLYPPAQEQSTRQYGYNQNHTDILNDEDMISDIINQIDKYKFDFPESHMKYLIQGGFDVQLPNSYSDHEKFAIHYLGKYIRAIANGLLQPIDKYGEHFLSVLKGEEKPNLFTESAWLKFRSDYPELANEAL